MENFVALATVLFMLVGVVFITDFYLDFNTPQWVEGLLFLLIVVSFGGQIVLARRKRASADIGETS
tara:strand:+ start:304 stop:501 length:198 start_codon:yes stop_codon:yes gene_type:complete